MTTRRASRPLSSFLLRVHEERVETVVRSYELLDLASGTALRFATLAALQRHLRKVEDPQACSDTKPA